MVADKKMKFQESLNADPDKLDSARDYSKKLQDLGRTMVSGLYMLVRNVKLYDPANVIFNKPIEQLMECINVIISMEGELSLQVAGDSFYLNNMLLRTELKSAENLRTLASEMEAKDVGGFMLDQSITSDELRSFMHIFSSENVESAGERGVSTHKLEALKLRRFEKLQEIIRQQKELEDSGELDDRADKSLDRKRYGLVVYSRTVIFMRNFFLGQRGEGPEVPMGKSMHLIQDLVDVCHGKKNNFLGVSSVDKGEEYLAFHSVNVALLAIVFGGELGLPKERLRELGIAALFHDLGLVEVSEDLLNKSGKLTPAEKRQLSASALLGVMRILRTNPISKRTIQCVLAAFHHSTDWGRPVKDHLGNLHHAAQVNDLGVFEMIIAIADCYDRLVFQQSLNPDLAVALMNTEMSYRFEPDLLRIFSHLMKGYSSKILSSSGEKLELF